MLGFAKQSGGGVRIQSRWARNLGAYLPAESRGKGRPAAPEASEKPSPETFRGAAILLVDDDNEVREVTRAMLRDQGHRVMEAGSGGAALDILEREPGVELLILDSPCRE